jgi:hypothetical protein
MAFSLGACGGEDSQPPTVPDSVMMYVQCQELVKDRLKAPSTAKFPAITQVKKGTFGEPEDSLYRIIGFVDAQNTFGAALRSDFKCDMRWRGGDRFLPVDIIVR